MGFLKFKDQKDGNGRGDLHWHRANSDGAPFRANGSIPILREEEYSEMTERVYDTKHATFDTNNPEEQIHGRTYQDVLDAITAGWFNLLNPREYKWGDNEDGKPTMYVYVEWAEPFQEFTGKRQQP